MNTNHTLNTLWNDRNLLTAKINDLLKDFCEKYDLRPDEVTLVYNYAGFYLRVIV